MYVYILYILYVLSTHMYIHIYMYLYICIWIETIISILIGYKIYYSGGKNANIFILDLTKHIYFFQNSILHKDYDLTCSIKFKSTFWRRNGVPQTNNRKDIREMGLCHLWMYLWMYLNSMLCVLFNRKMAELFT